MFGRSLVLSILALLGLASLSAALPQGGYTTLKPLSKYGLEKLPVPRDYDPIPVQPTEEWMILRFAERQLDDPREQKKYTPSVRFVWIPWVEDPPPPEPEVAPDPPPPDEEGRTRSKPVSDEKKPAPLPPINCLERYLAQRMKQITLGDLEEQKPRDGYERMLYESLPVKKANDDGHTDLVAWIWEWRRDERTLAMIATCHEDDYPKQAKIWEHMASSLRLVEPEAVDMSKWVRFYERRPKFKGAEFRVKIREQLEMTKGWKAEDTENYIVIYDTKDEALIRAIKRELEAIRKVYERLFPAVEPVTAVSAVRVCKDQDGYLLYGGPRGSGGYWNWVAEELVFYDYEDVGRERGSGKANSRIVLYHEAFHQYVFYSAGSMSPHSWFNEGHGDYFSGARFDRTGEVSMIGVNPWRINTIQRMVREREYTSWSEIIEYSQSKYYANGGPNYAQGWSMIYFLRESKEVLRREEWAKILPTYFQVMKDAYDQEEAQLALADQLEDRVQVEAAQQRARERAVKEAFAGVDLLEIEEAWAKFTLELEAPR